MCRWEPEYTESEQYERGDITNDVSALVEKFATGHLTAEEWNHDTHLVVGLYYAWQHGAQYALELMRQGVRRTNLHLGLPDGFNETITRAFLELLHVVQDYHYDSDDGFEDLLDKVRKSALADKSVLLEFYSREVLLSEQAKTEWVPPDKQDITDIAVQRLFKKPKAVPKVDAHVRFPPTKVEPKKVPALVLEARR